VLRWEPHVSLEHGIALTYRWIEAQVAAALRLGEVSHVA
jgi:nucleoside-diphosphate-sugar epimerase